MNPKGKYGVLLLSSVLVTYAIIGGMLHRVSAQDGSYRQLDLFNEVLGKVQSDYVDSPSTSNALAGAIRGLIETVDPEGGYLSAKDVDFYKSFDPLKTPGIGVILGRRAGYPVILSVLPGGTAEKAGLTTGDMIEAIDGTPTREMNLVQVDGYLANPPDKPAMLTVMIRKNNFEPDTMAVPRGVTKVPSVDFRMIDNNIAYVHVPLLADGKASEARKDIDDLLKRGATSVILDLRASAGGTEAEGVALASIFLDSGTIGYTLGQKSEKHTLVIDPRVTLTKAPLAVLVNEGTAGPAELVAGAIRDAKRGQLVGWTTFGVGSVQKLIPMDNGAALLIAVARYYTPSGKVIEDAGVEPQVKVQAQEEEQLDLSGEQEIEIPVAPKKEAPASTEDRQLKRAIEVLKDPQSAQTAKKAA